MTPRSLWTLFMFLTALAVGTNAFSSPQQQTRPVAFLKMSDREGGLSIAKPKIGQKTAVVTETKKKVEFKKKNRTAGPESRVVEDFMEAPLYKVMLLGDDAYDKAHVIERICAIVEGLDEDAANTIFQVAQTAGKAMIGKHPMEIAEVYKEQLLRSDPMIFADMEEENS